MNHVTAADFVRKFARYRDDARTGPVYVTHHGRETHVLCDVDTFRTLQHTSSDEVSPDSPTVRFGLADWIDEGIIACDENLVITFANRIAHSLVRATPGTLVGRPLTAALPRIGGTVMEVQARETLRQGEPNMADLPSPFLVSAWIRFQSFMLDDHLVLRLRDITAEAERHFKANVKEAIVKAMDVHGDICYARLSLRGTIDRVDEAFSKLLDLPATRLDGVALGDLVVSADKPRYREVLETVLRGNEPEKVRLRLLTNSGIPVDVILSMVRLQGLYGTEGAVALMTRAPTEQTGSSEA
ncbi:histidine kinase [Novosphingobium sp. 9]|uniref:histidine kinase n=1 Tax=Novosphingobium sp. 9 TaxID=2025349 RepID=UPI0021B63B57|nr:histidine kinase [Novosphingobium sp. 9]